MDTSQGCPKRAAISGSCRFKRENFGKFPVIPENIGAADCWLIKRRGERNRSGKTGSGFEFPRFCPSVEERLAGWIAYLGMGQAESWFWY
jgi:hypothetical protein